MVNLSLLFLPLSCNCSYYWFVLRGIFLQQSMKHTHARRDTRTHTHTSSSMTNFSAPKMVSHCVLNLHLLVMSLFLIWALDYAHSFTVTGVALFLTVWSHALHVSSLSHLCRGVQSLTKKKLKPSMCFVIFSWCGFLYFICCLFLPAV